jgi:hypothetical protein
MTPDHEGDINQEPNQGGISSVLRPDARVSPVSYDIWYTLRGSNTIYNKNRIRELQEEIKTLVGRAREHC